jgi:hypothetical protein
MDIAKLSTEEASRVLCLFLAQSEGPEKPHEQLGFNTAQSAFKGLGQLFQRKENTIKNERDAFDFYTDSPRVGWKVPLKPSLESIWEKYGHISRADLLAISQHIIKNQRSKLSMVQPNIFDVVAALDTETRLKRPDADNNVVFSNMQEGKKRKWYSMSVSQIVTCLEDYKKPEFQSIDTSLPYHDDRWRKTHYKLHFSDVVMRSLGSAQGSSVFSVLAKLIQKANDLDVHHKLCPIDPPLLDVTIARIQNDMIQSRALSSPAGESNQGSAKTGGENILFYGAPGTGKSYKMKDKTHKSPNVTTVFHSDMQNSDFLGALKPAVNGKNVTYLFSPGPFAKALRDAYKHPDQNVYLVIEELNRAPAMAVFGELFQLLDRKDNGESVYGVSFPSEEFQAWLNKETSMVHEEIRLPSNFSIYASINSADQGVYPLDTAFRRRWHQEYIHIDWNDTKIADRTIIIIKADGSVANWSWKALGGALNKELEDQYPEDRLLGQWWINNRDIENSNGLVPNKLLNYLWDDLLRHDEETKKKIFKPEIQRFGKLIEKNNGSDPKQIFSDNFLEKIVAQDA